MVLLLDQALLRRALGLFATGVTIITTYDSRTGAPRGMTANAFMSGSLEPALIIISVATSARMHDLLQESGAYAVNVLPEGLEREARRFAGRRVDSHEPPPRFTECAGVPLIEGALAALAARVVDTHPVGDHTLFIGEVLDVVTGDTVDAPLVFHGSRFCGMTGAEREDAWAWNGVLDLWG